MGTHPIFESDFDCLTAAMEAENYELGYTGSSYSGDMKNGRMEGKGEYSFASGTRYCGEMKDGQFHGSGVLHMTTGARIDGTWADGKMVEGKLTFADGLQFEDSDDWAFCQPTDRRFYTEQCNGIRPAGRSQLTNDHPPRKIPEGHYDTGDGFYDPVKRIVNNYEGAFLRYADDEEHEWNIKYCRKAWDEIVGFKN